MHLFVNVEHVSNNSQQTNPKNRENEGKRISTHLQVKSPKPESAEWTEEKQGYRNLNDKGSHYTQLLPPNWQLVGKPGQRGGNTLSLIVVCQCCPTHGEKYQQNENRNIDKCLIVWLTKRNTKQTILNAMTTAAGWDVTGVKLQYSSSNVHSQQTHSETYLSSYVQTGATSSVTGRIW